MERTRAAPPTSSADVADVGVESLPQGKPSPLTRLIQEVRSPGVIRSDVDALIRRLSWPLPPEQSAREHADLLLSLIEDDSLPDINGTDGRTVRGAAVQALVALGYPYALEVPPEALAAQVAANQSLPRSLLSEPKGRRGFTIISVLGALMMIPVLIMSLGERSLKGFVLASIFTGCLSFFPALLTLLGHNTRSGILKGLGTIWLMLCTFLWGGMGLAALFSGSPWGLIPLGIAALYIHGTWLMNSKS